MSEVPKATIVEREKNWHNKRFDGGNDTRNVPLLQYAYKATDFAVKRFLRLQDIDNLSVLDIGCGLGISRAQHFCSKGCSYVGVDISDECIKANLREISNTSVDARFFCDDANTLLSLADQKFDLIVMSGTLHHLDIKTSLATFSTLLSDNGRLLMFEPMGENPFINFFRYLTPNFRTDDEHPLTFDDLRYIASVLPDTRIEFHTLFSLLSIFTCFIADIMNWHKVSNVFVRILGRIDMRLGKFPIVNRLHWIVIIDAGL